MIQFDLIHAYELIQFSLLLYAVRKCGGTSASRDENGQVDVWR